MKHVEILNSLRPHGKLALAGLTPYADTLSLAAHFLLQISSPGHTQKA